MARVSTLGLTRHAARSILREAAEQTGRIGFTDHAVRQMRARHISRMQVVRCLRHGGITEGPTLDHYGKWVCRVEHLTAGDAIAVVAAIDLPSRVIVITVFEVT